MKNLLFTIFLLINSILFSQDKINVTVTILPQKYFVEKIAREKAIVNVMIPPGANPATYDINTRKIKKLSRSKIYFKIGYLPFELSWMEKIKNTNPDMTIIDTSKGVQLIKSEKYHHDERFYSGIDPHIWLSPKEVKIQAKNILEAFKKTDPYNSDFYQKNYDNFLSEVNSIQNTLENNFKYVKNNKFLVFHPSWGYFARDFNLEQIAIETEGKNPTPKELKKFIDIAKKENIKVIFLQKQFPTNSANTISKEIYGEIIFIDPLAENWSENMLEISQKIKNNLN